jgi:PAS domain S-box-containing protein
MDLRKELSDIKGILKDNPRGMTVTEISKEIKMNRHSVAKYMDMLFISGHVEMKSFGSSKVFYLSRRLPMSAILNFSSDFIIILNKDLEIINVNDRFLAFENIEKQDILDKSIINSSFPMEFNPSIIPNIKEALAGKESTIEAYLKKDDAPYYFTVKLVPTVFDDTEKGVTIIFEDITERKNAETALKVSEERFRAIFEHAAVGIAYLSPDGHFLRLNQRFCDILGYTQDEITKLAYMDITYPEDKKASMEYVKRLYFGDVSSFSMEKRYIKKDGSFAWAHLTASCIRKPDGPVEYTIAVIEDISGRKQAEEALRRAHEELEIRVHERTAALKNANEALLSEIDRSKGMEVEITRAYHMMHDIIEKAPFGIYVVNGQGCIEYVNPAMLKISGDDDREFRNMNVFELPTYQDIGLSERIKSALGGEYFYLGPVEYTSHYGKKTSLRNFIGMKKVLVFVEDISGHKHMEEKLHKNELLLHDIVNNLK